MMQDTSALNQQRHPIADDESVWLFGYGSLIWKAGFPYLERRRATIYGWERRFWQGSHDHRGTLESPGRVATLIASSGTPCHGMAYRISGETWSTWPLRIIRLSWGILLSRLLLSRLIAPTAQVARTVITCLTWPRRYARWPLRMTISWRWKGTCWRCVRLILKRSGQQPGKNHQPQHNAHDGAQQCTAQQSADAPPQCPQPDHQHQYAEK